MIFWVCYDRRRKRKDIFENFIYGNIYVVYKNKEAAKAACYKTEKVWKFEIKLKEEK